MTTPVPAAEKSGHPTEPTEGRMSLSEHLTELRSRLLKCTISVLILGTLSLVFAKEIYGLLMRPVLLALPPGSSQLVYTSAIEEINVFMKVGLYSGVFLSTPVVLWQIWGFVAPGLYKEEKKMAGPFILFGTVAFLSGALFCYWALLPTMFKFLLREEGTVAIEDRLNAARVREQESLRFLRLGDATGAAALAKRAHEELTAFGDGQVTGDMGLSLLPKRSVELMGRLEGLGRMIDALAEGQGPSARPELLKLMSARVAAAEAFSRGDYGEVEGKIDEVASQLASAYPRGAAELAEVWKLERALGAGTAKLESLNWTKPMLTMADQLTLVLVLELALGVIFELPLVMALLGMLGLVRSGFLFKYQRHAFVACLVLAAIITPTGDVVNLSLMAGPMLLCYELGVLFVWLIERKRKKEEVAIAPT